jgi:hypothetical protein
MCSHEKLFLVVWLVLDSCREPAVAAGSYRQAWAAADSRTCMDIAKPALEQQQYPAARAYMLSWH